MEEQLGLSPNPEHRSTTALPDDFLTSETAMALASYSLPYFDEIPNIGLYREQVILYVEHVLSPLTGGITDVWLTASMVNNYIKSGLIDPPVKKTYTREQITQLLICCILKQVIPIPLIGELLEIQKAAASTEVAYNSFVDQLAYALEKVFAVQNQTHAPTEPATTREGTLIRASAYAFANAVLLTTYLKYRG